MAVHTRRNGCEIGTAEHPRSTARTWVAFAPKVLALAFLAILGLAGPALAAEDGPYPVWWSDKLRLESLEQVEARLEGPFWGSGESYTVYKGVGDGRSETTVDTCNMRRDLFEEGYYAEAPQQYFEVYLWAMCDALEKLGTAQPAQRSFVRNFVFDRNAMNVLPAIVGWSESCDFMCRLRLANERGVTWTQIEDSILKRRARENKSIPLTGEVRSIQVEDDKTATILFEYIEEVPIEGERTTIWSYSVDRNLLEILAYGDFNEDGQEDMLIRLQGAPTVFVLTRDTPDTVFYVLNAEEHLCPNYQCDAEYNYPDVLRDPEAGRAD